MPVSFENKELVLENIELLKWIKMELEKDGTFCGESAGAIMNAVTRQKLERKVNASK